MIRNVMKDNTMRVVLFLFMLLAGCGLSLMVTSTANAAVGFGGSGGGGGGGGATPPGYRMISYFNDDYNNTNFGNNRYNDFVNRFTNSLTTSNKGTATNRMRTACSNALNNAGRGNNGAPSRVIGWVATIGNYGGVTNTAGTTVGTWQWGFDKDNVRGNINGGLKNYPGNIKDLIANTMRNNVVSDQVVYCVAINMNDVRIIGWTRHEEKGYDLGSRTSTKNNQMPYCAAYYKDETLGTDGYPLQSGSASQGSKTSSTAYAKIVNDFLAGKYGDFKGGGSISQQKQVEAKLQDAINAACDSANKQQTSIGLNDSQQKTLAKGGIQEFIHSKKIATVTIPDPTAHWYWREANHITWTYGCTVNRDKGCQRTTNGESHDWWWNSGWHSIGYSGKIGGHGVFRTPYCMSNDSSDRGSTSYNNYLTGCFSNAGSMNPVANDKQSFTHVSHFYIANMLCDTKDFQAYKSRVAGAVAQDTSDSKAGKFHGTLRSVVSTDANAVQFPRVTRYLTNNFDKTRVNGEAGTSPVEKLMSNTNPNSLDALSAVYTASGYKAINDPVYSKECPFDCSAAPVKGAANGSANNVGTNGADTSTSYGLKITQNDAQGNQTDKTSNSGKLTLFRNNAWNHLDSDIWYPLNDDGVSYDGSKAESTTAIINNDGTPWMVNGTLVTKINKTGTGDTSIFANRDSNNTNIPTQRSLETSTFNGSRTVIMPGQQTDFYIKSPWASDAGKPIRMTLKWEYKVSNTVNIPTNITFNGTSTVAGYDYGKVSASSDGKCYGYYGSDSGSVPDATTETHSNTGGSSTDVTDRDITNKPSILIQFVRSTAE